MKLRLPWLFSILAHVGILVLLITLSPHTLFRLNNSAPNLPAIHASVIFDEKPKLDQQKILEAQQLASIKAQQEQQAKALALKKQQEIDLAAQAKANAERRQKELAQAKAKAEELAQAKVEAEKKQKQLVKAEAERKQQEQQKLAQVKAAAEAKAQAVAQQQKQQELAAKQQALQEQLLQRQIANERQELARAQQMRGVIDQYRARILMAIASQWVIPDETDPSISCLFSIELNPQGVVSRVQLVKGSGNTALDRAAETAIYKASPLPVPKDPQIFAPFRKFTLKMTPQDVR